MYTQAEKQDMAVQDRAVQDRAVQDRAAQDRAVQDRAAQDRAVQERAAQDRAVQDRAVNYQQTWSSFSSKSQHFRGSTKFPNQHLRQIGLEVHEL